MIHSDNRFRGSFIYKKAIMSLPSQTIKDICSLHASKGRKSSNMFLAEGTRTVFSLIQSNWRPVHVYIVHDKQELMDDIDTAIPCTLVSEKTMERISASSTPSGILAIFKMPPNPPAEKLSSGLVLAAVSDPGNMGTLIRSCAAFGYKSVIVVEGCDPFSPKVIQSTAGALANITLFRWTWADLVAHKNDFSLCALVLQGGKNSAEIKSVIGKTLLVVGNEAHGIQEEWLANCDTTMTLSMNGHVESLNAAVAGSIALYMCSLKS
jgi:TrmH family RNA methyltransferase